MEHFLILVWTSCLVGASVVSEDACFWSGLEVDDSRTRRHLHLRLHQMVIGLMPTVPNSKLPHEPGLGYSSTRNQDNYQREQRHLGEPYRHGICTV